MAITYDPAITVTEVAAGKIRDLLAEEEGAHLRLFVTKGGCSGYSYGMTLDTEVREGDQVIEQHGVRMLADTLAVRLLRGARIDYVRSPMGEGFALHNPNAVSTCGCGHSFTTADDAGEVELCGEQDAQAEGGAGTAQA